MTRKWISGFIVVAIVWTLCSFAHVGRIEDTDNCVIHKPLGQYKVIDD